MQQRRSCPGAIPSAPRVALPARSQSLDFINLADLDGSLTGLGPNTAVLGPNAMQALPSPVCAAKPEWSGFVCPGVKQRSFGIMDTGAFVDGEEGGIMATGAFVDG